MYENSQLVLHSSHVEPGEIIWRSPSNIALIKYWGKKDNQIPRNTSLSFTLTNAFTDLRLSYEPQTTGSGISLDFKFNGEENDAFRQKIYSYLESITNIYPFLKQLHLTIESGNSFPHSSGIASSASSMSALALSLCSLEERLFDSFGDDDTAFDQKASYLARLGSGSACRSIFSKAAVWGESGGYPGSSNEYAIGIEDELHEVFKGYHDDILIVSSASKSVSSRAGHNLMDNHAYSHQRYDQAKMHLARLKEILKRGDLEAFVPLVEQEALTLHALMMMSNPPFILMKPNTLAIIEKIKAYRADTGHPICFTLDAGPNIHLLYPENIIHDVRAWLQEEVADLLEDGIIIDDFVGDGPEEM